MKRIQRKRAKGWRMPKNAVYVGRPGIFGNPHKTPDLAYNLRNFRFAIEWELSSIGYDCPPASNYKWARRIAENLHKLKGKNLACWCPLDQPCHADILIDLVKAHCSKRKSKPTL